MAYPTYSPTDWVDLSTLVDEAHMDKIEQGIKANNDAIQDLDGRVGAIGGADWEGAWNPATAYVKGDVVTYQGSTYIAVNPSTGQVPPTVIGPAPPGFINVKDYGALGNGTADDSAAIQAAINAMPAGYSGVLWFPPGSYMIGTTLVLPNTKRGTFAGTGPRGSNLQALPGLVGDMLRVDGQMWVIRDLSFDGGKAVAASATNCIKITATKVWVQNLWITASKTAGIEIVGTSGSFALGNKLSNLYFSDCGTHGIYLNQYAYDTEIIQCWVGTSGSDGIRIQTSNAFVTASHCWGNAGHGVHCVSGSSGHNRLTNCYLETNTQRGFYAGSGNPGCILTGCTVRDNGGVGIYFFSSNRCVVSACTVYNNVGEGVKFDTCTGGTCVGCNIWDEKGTKTQTYPIFDNGSTDIVFVGNNAKAANHLTGGPRILGAGGVVLGNAGEDELVTALPTTPYNGQVVILTDSLTAPTYQWRLKYIAAKATNKWLYLGGSSKYIAATPNAILNTLTQVGSLGIYRNTGTDFVVPAPGIYKVTARFRMEPNGNANVGSLRLFAGTAFAELGSGAAWGLTQSAGGWAQDFTMSDRVSATAGQTIGAGADSSAAGTHKIVTQNVEYEPVAVGG